MDYAIKAEIADPAAPDFVFDRQKTMYGGKQIAVGDRVFLFASETQGGAGLVGCGVVTAAQAVPLRPGVERQTPCVSIAVRRTATARQRLGRDQLKSFADWHDGRPETELNFKFYRQATNKVVGLSDAAAAFLAELLQPGVAQFAPARTQRLRGFRACPSNAPKRARSRRKAQP